MLLNRDYTNNVDSAKTPPPLISLFIILQYHKFMTHLDYQCNQNRLVCCNIFDFSSLTYHKCVNIL